LSALVLRVESVQGSPTTPENKIQTELVCKTAADGKAFGNKAKANGK
jgi:hypothetical protein